MFKLCGHMVLVGIRGKRIVICHFGYWYKMPILALDKRVGLRGHHDEYFCFHICNGEDPLLLYFHTAQRGI